METIITVLGYLSLLALLFFALMQALARFLTLEKSNGAVAMPVLIPVPILTTKQSTPIHKLVAYVTEIRQWQVAENWAYKKGDKTLVIPKGFIFDGASIPRVLWGVLSPTGLLLIPGLIHDFGYRYDYIWCVDANSKTGFIKLHKCAGRKVWDKIFYEVGTKVDGIPLINALAWLALTTLGGIAWKKNRAKNADEIYPY